MAASKTLVFNVISIGTILFFLHKKKTCIYSYEMVAKNMFKIGIETC